jgi:hypothetical protein
MPMLAKVIAALASAPVSAPSSPRPDVSVSWDLRHCWVSDGHRQEAASPKGSFGEAAPASPRPSSPQARSPVSSPRPGRLLFGKAALQFHDVCCFSRRGSPGSFFGSDSFTPSRPQGRPSGRCSERR